MAAPVGTMRSVFRLSIRKFSASCGVQGGQQWRIQHGLAKNNTDYGPMTDLPDWSFADGRPAPLLKGQLRRRQEREVLAKRIVMLNTEMDKGIEMCKKKQEEDKKAEEHRKSLLLKPKGKLLIKQKSKS